MEMRILRDPVVHGDRNPAVSVSYGSGLGPKTIKLDSGCRTNLAAHSIEVEVQERA
jgi:hypothetical protein